MKKNISWLDLKDGGAFTAVDENNRLALIYNKKMGKYRVILNGKALCSYKSFYKTYVFYVDTAQENNMLHLITD